MTASWTRLALPPFSMCCKVSSEVNRPGAGWSAACHGAAEQVFRVQCWVIAWHVHVPLLYETLNQFCGRENAIVRPCLSLSTAL